jgi:hypothetical protein
MDIPILSLNLSSITNTNTRISYLSLSISIINPFRRPLPPTLNLSLSF